MPTYDYSCEKCGHKFEQFQSMTDDPLEICPKEKCARKRWGKGKIKRAVGGGAGLIFKGSGFYITDYRSENYKAAAKKESSSSSPPKEGKSAKSSDSTKASSDTSKPATGKSAGNTKPPSSAGGKSTD